MKSKLAGKPLIERCSSLIAIEQVDQGQIGLPESDDSEN
jgi:hypothetical protein